MWVNYSRYYLKTIKKVKLNKSYLLNSLLDPEWTGQIIDLLYILSKYHWLWVLESPIGKWTCLDYCVASK